jgi:hypothetical protein
MAEYKNTSPWFQTPMNNDYLDLFEPRAVPNQKDDQVYEIESQFRHRPDLLANDLYGSPRLWWVFSQRNPTVLKDPIYDFEPGTFIYIPSAEALKNTLGV